MPFRRYATPLERHYCIAAIDYAERAALSLPEPLVIAGAFRQLRFRRFRQRRHASAAPPATALLPLRGHADAGC